MGIRAYFAVLAVVIGFVTAPCALGKKIRLTDIERLGQAIFNDKNLSQPAGQSCATCHSADLAFTDPESKKATSNGVLTKRFGKRNAPTIAYTSFSPEFHYDEDGGTYVGGLFFDGRVDNLAEQARLPFLDQSEMHSPDIRHVTQGVRNADYAPLFKKVFGAGAFNKSINRIYGHITEAIAAFEASAAVNQFSSKFDYYLKGEAQLTAIEARGLKLFNGKANCFACHPSTVVGDEPGPLFTDFTYDNIGIPKNWNNPFLRMPSTLNPDGREFIDYGLANTVLEFDTEGAAAEAGKFKVPTLRNLELTAPYGHNGYFKTIKQIVQFYNTRDVASFEWPEGEVPETVNHDELGDLHLSDDEVDSVVAFLLTLTDGYRPGR